MIIKTFMSSFIANSGFACLEPFWVNGCDNTENQNIVYITFVKVWNIKFEEIKSTL